MSDPPPRMFEGPPIEDGDGGPREIADRDAEREVLAAVLVDQSLLAVARGRLDASDFTSPLHSVWVAMCAAADAGGDPSDLHAILRALSVRPGSWVQVLGSVSERRGTTHGFGRYVEAVAVASQRRKAHDVGTWIAAEAATGVDDHADWLAGLPARIEAVTRGASGVQLTSLRDGLSATVERMAESAERGYTGGVSHGFEGLGKLLPDLGNGHLIVLSGQPGSGKTALACNVADNVASAGGRVLIYSLEMPGHELICRMIASRAMVDNGRLRRGELQDDDWPRVSTAVDDLQSIPIDYTDAGGLSIGEVASSVHAECRGESVPALVVVDYLQRVKSRSGRSREEEIGSVVRASKTLAKAVDRPVLLLSSMNRAGRDAKRPKMSDLRGSGEIEFEADAVIFVHAPDKKSSARELIIAKSRHGAQGTVPMSFSGSHCRFSDAVRSWGDVG